MQPTDDGIIQFLDRKIQHHLAKAKYYEGQKATVLAILAEAMHDGSRQAAIHCHDSEAHPPFGGKYASDTMKNAVVRILNELRNQDAPAPTTKELYDALTEGGYRFNGSDEYNKRMGALSTFLSRWKKAKMITRDAEKRIHLTDGVLGGLPEDEK